MKFSFWKWIWCVVTLNHLDPGVVIISDKRGSNRLYCKRCGIAAK